MQSFSETELGLVAASSLLGPGRITSAQGLPIAALKGWAIGIPVADEESLSAMNTNIAADAINAVNEALANPTVGLATGFGAGSGEALNQFLFGDGSFNYERIVNASVIGAATAPFAGVFSGYAGTALLGGGANAAATAYNNSQSGSNDSILAAGAVGMTFGAGAKFLGDTTGLFAGRVLNYTRQYDPSLGVLLQPAGGRLIVNPVQSSLPSILRDMNGMLLPAAGGGVHLPETPAANGRKP